KTEQLSVFIVIHGRLRFARIVRPTRAHSRVPAFSLFHRKPNPVFKLLLIQYELHSVFARVVIQFLQQHSPVHLRGLNLHFHDFGFAPGLRSARRKRQHQQRKCQHTSSFSPPAPTNSIPSEPNQAPSAPSPHPSVRLAQNSLSRRLFRQLLQAPFS